MKEKIIRNYLSNIDWNSNWSYKTIREDLKKLLGEMPAVDISYKKDLIINEATDEAIEVKKIDKISVLYTDIEKGDNTFSKYEIRF